MSSSSFEKRAAREYALVLALILASLYGATYQQYRHFDYQDTRGVTDSHSYVEMAQGRWDVPVVHRYRFAIPLAVGAVCRACNRCDVDGVLFIFYAINFVTMFAVLAIFYWFLKRLGFHPTSSLIGVLLVIGSRITVLTTATPLLDSAYYLAVLAIFALSTAGRFNTLLVLFPVLILAKETVILFLFVPLFVPEFRRKRYLFSWLVALTASVLAFGATRRFIGLAAATRSAIQGDFSAVVAEHLHGVFATVKHVISIRGLNDLQHGFTLLLPLAIVGFYLDRKNNKRKVPSLLLFVVPVSIGYALLSGNLGRMLFGSFVVVIPYVLVVLDRMLGHSESRPQWTIRDQAAR